MGLAVAENACDVIIDENTKIENTESIMQKRKQSVGENII